ncbi:hypothetical protein [Cognatitamlana onchidii]|uniref:hypothetical protein n=1 Tax=Cognatitamlana onchidii TaxID=2562860 RepID=UPI0010A6004B|nr:hypothetical protein [Algibacter onchidii]
MKKVLLVVMAIMSLQAIAQKPKSGQKGERKNMIMKLSAEETATLQTKRMTLYLDLNKEQQNKIQALNLEKAKKRKAMMAERKKKRENGTTQKPSKEERYAKELDRLDRMIAEKAKMKTILNKEQFEKWEKAKMRMAMKHKQKKQNSKKRT